MVVNKTVKAVHAARAVGIEERDSRRRRNGQSAMVGNHVGNMLCDQAVRFAQYLFRFPSRSETHQAIRSSHFHGATFDVRRNPVHAKNVVIFDVQRARRPVRQNVEAVVEIADPQLSIFVASKG